MEEDDLDKEEKEGLVAFVQEAKEKFVFFSPTNSQDPKWRDRYRSIEQVEDMLSEKSDNVISVNKDIPTAAEIYITTRYFKGVYEDDKFKSSIEVREEVKEILDEICEDWDGPNVKAMSNRLKDEMDIQDAA